ncbi:hypothetical protein J6590_008047 [Homalodisca vitripennis]|nr:hypothetical protein J6590_008047 [Homalodisca vitripennis]
MAAPQVIFSCSYEFFQRVGWPAHKKSWIALLVLEECSTVYGHCSLDFFHTGLCDVLAGHSFWSFLYTFLLLLIFLLEVMAGLLAYVYQAQVGDELAVTLNATFLETYRIKNEQTAAIDKMQQELTCCGVKSFEDWQYSVWKQQSGESPIRVPDTCCLTPSPGCGRSISPSNIYYAVRIHSLANIVKKTN